MQLNLRQYAVVKGTNRAAVQLRATQLKNEYLICPAMAITPVAWAGASYIVAILTVPITTPYTFTVPIAIKSVTFVPCIKWVVGQQVYRYKLWSTGTEILPYYVYTGQTIPPGAVIEIWAVQGSPVNVAEWTLQLGFILDPMDSGDFADVPLATASACLIGTQTTLDGMFLTCN